MDAIVGDAKVEVGAALSEWRKVMASIQANHPPVVGTGVTEEGKASFAPPDMFLRAAPRVSRQ
jgi:putative membrane protein